MTEEKINRINELYHKSKAEGLTEAEKQEQAMLRKQFLADIRQAVTSNLNNIDLVDKDGSVENLGEKYGNKKGLS